MFKREKRFINGFTLLEIVLVIAILGILLMLISGNLLTSAKRGRDARRKAEIKNLQNTSEIYFSLNDKYPVATSDLASQFPAGLPIDPQTKANYSYQFDTVDPVGETYCICATLEITDSGNAYNLSCNFTPSVPPTLKNYFCVKNLQE